MSAADPRKVQLCPRTYARGYDSVWNSALSSSLTAAVCATYQDEEGINHIDGTTMPQSEEILAILDLVLEVMFPGYTGRYPFTRVDLESTIGGYINQIFHRLSVQIERAFAYRCSLQRCEGCDCRKQAEQAVVSLLRGLPDIREALKTDVHSALGGDPAAKSTDEVVIAYPGLKAIAVHRVAHELYAAGVPLIPRVMSEYAHTATGIDIHPGAVIGRNFFIDHGTGVVIGETAVLGDHVRLYQGVTLGAHNFPQDERGHLIKGLKRHPHLEDHVTVYAGATILGDIAIGHHSVIGGNVWLAESVPPHTKITVAPSDLAVHTTRRDT